MAQAKPKLGRKYLVAGITGVLSILAVTLFSVSTLGATPLTPLTGSGANVVWPYGSGGQSSSNGAFTCGTTVRMTMASGFGNSGVSFDQNWSTSTATNNAFTGGISPNSAVAIHGNAGGVLVTLNFGIEVTNPVLLINYIDPGASMLFASGSTLNLVDWHSDKSGADPVITANSIALEALTDNENEGWAVQLVGTYGPTSGSLTFNYISTNDSTAGFSVALASGTECLPPAPAPTPEPVPARFTG
ncbi:MAG: hypothetical protein WCJ88_03205 [Actinomycetes bacterium]